MNVPVSDAALELLRPLFVAVEGSCEARADDEIVRRVFIRGAMEYAKSAGKSWDDVLATAAQLRTELADA
jgi:hypothetical protein